MSTYTVNDLKNLKKAITRYGEARYEEATAGTLPPAEAAEVRDTARNAEEILKVEMGKLSTFINRSN